METQPAVVDTAFDGTSIWTLTVEDANETEYVLAIQGEVPLPSLSGKPSFYQYTKLVNGVFTSMTHHKTFDEARAAGLEFIRQLAEER